MLIIFFAVHLRAADIANTVTVAVAAAGGGGVEPPRMYTPN